MVIYSGRMLENVVESSLTPNKGIFLKIPRSSKNFFCAYPTIIEFHETMFASCILSNYSQALCILSHVAYIAIRAITTTIFDEKPFSTTLGWASIPSFRTPMVAHVGRMLEKVGKSNFTHTNAFA